MSEQLSRQSPELQVFTQEYWDNDAGASPQPTILEIQKVKAPKMNTFLNVKFAQRYQDIKNGNYPLTPIPRDGVLFTPCLDNEIFNTPGMLLLADTEDLVLPVGTSPEDFDVDETTTYERNSVKITRTDTVSLETLEFLRAGADKTDLLSNVIAGMGNAYDTFTDIERTVRYSRQTFLATPVEVKGIRVIFAICNWHHFKYGTPKLGLKDRQVLIPYQLHRTLETHPVFSDGTPHTRLSRLRELYMCGSAEIADQKSSIFSKFGRLTLDH